MNYTNKNFTYTDPQAYDERVRQPIESFIASEWDPILLKYLKNEIHEGMIVADLGCGTFIHTHHMGKAAHIYAVDINQKMLTFGQPKIDKLRNKISVLCESGTQTSIPSVSCDLVWIDGLSEFLNLPDLFQEVSRILKPEGKFIILYQNKYHPENLLIALFYWLRKRSGKKYRSLYEFKKISRLFNFSLIKFESYAFFFYLPPFLQKHMIYFWKIINKVLLPIQSLFPIGNNIICTFIKEKN